MLGLFLFAFILVAVVIHEFRMVRKHPGRKKKVWLFTLIFFPSSMAFLAYSFTV